MSEIVKMTVYPFEELEEAARERAREWYRSLGDPEDWHACVLEDFTEVCERLGVRLRTHRVKLFGGGTREEPNVYFQGFGSQGDGACFEGEYTFVEDDVRTYAPRDRELHAIGEALARAQRENGCELHARVRQPTRDYWMAVDVEREGDRTMTPGTEDTVVKALRGLGRWLYHRLEREHASRHRDEAVDDELRANEWRFTCEGDHFPRSWANVR